MSTRATVWFHDKDAKKPEAIIYRHGDGYPEGLGTDLKRFFKEVEKLKDRRFHDPSYLAAKWVVFDAERMREYHMEKDTGSPLAFLSVGIMRQDPGDIEYRYHVICDGTPTLWGETVGGDKVEIPEPALDTVQ